MREEVSAFLVNNKLSESEVEKMLYAIGKLMLYKKEEELNMFSISINIVTMKFDFVNIETGENEFSQIFKRKEILIYRKYLRYIIKQLPLTNSLIENIYTLAKQNDGFGLNEIIENLSNETLSLYSRFVNETALESGSAKIKEQHEKFSSSEYDAPYCPACQERPCMCSDRDFY